jgi:TatD DNase family protein
MHCIDYDRLHFAPETTQRTHFRECFSFWNYDWMHELRARFFLYLNPGSQLALAKKYHLPLFLHSRAAHTDFVNILREEGFGEAGGAAVGGRGGVVHSFTGTAEEANELVGRSIQPLLHCLTRSEQMDMGFYISLNGCSLKTPENLAVAKTIRLDRLILETGGWIVCARFHRPNLNNRPCYADAPWCSMTNTHSSSEHIAHLPENLRAIFLPPASKAEKFVMGKPVSAFNRRYVFIPCPDPDIRSSLATNRPLSVPLHGYFILYMVCHCMNWWRQHGRTPCKYFH